MANYYYVGPDNQACGPIAPSEFLKHGLSSESLVCPEGGSSWTRLADVPGLLQYLQTSPAPQTPPYFNTPGGPGQEAYAPAPSNHLVWAILVTLFCCLPFGIVAIVKSSQVNGLWDSGRREEAYRAAAAAAKWCWASAICSLIGGVIYFVFIFLLAF
jgi:hypothetical protein